MKNMIIAAFTLMASFGVHAQETAKYSFESEKNWWVHPTMRSYASLSDEQTADGSSALKFECMDFDGFDVVNVIMPNSAPNIVTLPKGKYTMKVSVYRGDIAPTGFTINFKEGPNSKYLSTVWNITKVKKGEWTELSQDINLKEPTEVILAVLMRNVKPWNGVGTLYIDNLQIIKK